MSSLFLGIALDLKVWDFGGQEVFYATHQFFLSKEAIYIYAWTDEVIAQKNKEDDKIQSPAQKHDRWRNHDYWLDNIRMHGEHSSILVVKTHCLDAVGNFPFEGLKQSYLLKNNPIDFDAFSVEPRYLEKLKAELTRMLNDSPLLGSSFPNSYNSVIDSIAKDRESKKTEVSKKEFSILASDNSIAENDFDKLLSYLVKTGEVINFSENPKLKDRIFINPQHLTNQVYKLIEDNDYLTAEEGVFSEAYAKEKLGWADWEVLLELLISFELVFKKESDGELSYVAPQYLGRLPTSGNAHKTFMGHKREKELVCELKYPRFLPENVMINVLSNYGPYSIDAVYRDAIYFIKEGSTEGCIIELQEKERLVRIFASKEEMSLSVVKEVFEKFLELSKKAVIYISVDEGKQWVDASILQDALKENRDIPLIGGGYIQDKTVFDCLKNDKFIEREKEEKNIIIKPPSSIEEDKPSTVKEKNRTLIIAGIIAIIILLLPVWNHNSGKISILGLISLEINGNSGEASGGTAESENEEEKTVVTKATVIGGVYVNNKKATSSIIKAVAIKGDFTVNPVSLSGHEFTLRNVKLPDDKRLAIAITFPDNREESRVFNIPEPNENGVVNVGEVRISYEQKSGSNKPVIRIINKNIIQNSNNNNSKDSGNQKIGQ